MTAVTMNSPYPFSFHIGACSVANADEVLKSEEEELS
jgi:hypothetical protein